VASKELEQLRSVAGADAAFLRTLLADN
jgi:hypothetical protein